MFYKHPAECLLATRSVWVTSKQLLGYSSHSLKKPPFQHLLLGSLSERLLAALDYLMVPSQLERWGRWVQQRDGEGTGGLCLVGQLNGVARAEVMWECGV